MNPDLWRWADPNGQQRTVRFDELRAALAGGVIAPNTPVWRPGFHAWQPAHDVPELTSASDAGANGVVLNIPPPPLAMLAVQQNYEAASSSLVPAAPVAPSGAHDEPPPPPRYVPLASRPPSLHPSSGGMKTMLGGSAHIPGNAPVPTFPDQASAGAAPSGPGPAPRIGSSLPTTIGLPPPPELAEAVKAAQGTRPKSAPPPPTGGLSTELSGSLLVDADRSSALASRPDPSIDPVQSDLEDEPLRRSGGLQLIIEDLKRIKNRQAPKNKLAVGIAGGATLLVVILFVAGVASLASGPSTTTTASTLPSASVASKASLPPPSAAPSASAAPTTTPAPTETKPAPPALGDCAVAGDTKAIGSRAQIASGIEAHVLNGGIALGFAPSPREGLVELLDATTLAPTATARGKAFGGDTKRVTPAFASGKLSAVVDADRKGDKIAVRRVVVGPSLLDIGQAEGAIVWAPHVQSSYAKLFGLDGEGGVEALRAAPLADRKGIALAFRRGNSINVGVAKGETTLEAEGDLSKIGGSGQVGSPSIAVSGDRVIVAWADRGASEDWGIRWTKLVIGGSASEATPFAIPEGGLGGQAMSPSIAPLGGGRFFLVWTEGPVSNHQVRGITFDADGSTSGSAVGISPPGLNAGQPTAVVGPDGRGAVAFLAAKGKSLEVHATPIRCPAR